MLKLYSVKDNKAGTYGTPFFQPGDVQATRIFSAEINRAAADNLLYTHPDDFDLYELGSYDEQTGQVSTDNPSLLFSGQKAKKIIE